MREGIVFLLIGPSAAGKNTVQEKVLEHFPYMHAAKGCWTRPHRPGETDETADSISISVEEFMRLKDAGALTAVNNVHGNWYGTKLAEFIEPVRRGQPVLRIVTDDGADAVIKDLPDTLIATIYLEVPIHVVVERLLARGDKPEDIVRRVKTAEGELARLEDDRDEWDYVIDAIETPAEVAEQVISIIENEITAQENDQKNWDPASEIEAGAIACGRVAHVITRQPETSVEIDAGIKTWIAAGRVAAGNAVYNAITHQPDMYQLCPCDDCQTTYPHSSGSTLLERPEYAKGFVRAPFDATPKREEVPTEGEPLGMPTCHSCEERPSKIAMNSVALCRDCVETMAGTIR